jgi:periplasmic protein TonB
MENDEAKRRRIAFATSTGVHLLLVLFFLISMAWRAPDPPLPEFGIELNFGDSPEGSGDIQPETSTATPDQPEVTEEVPDEEITEAQQEAATEVIPSNRESVVTEPKEEKPAVVEKPKEETKEEAKSVQKPDEKQGYQPVSEGNDKDKTGDKGDPKGTPDPNAAYSGKAGGGAGGEGMSLSMAGWTWAEQPTIPQVPDNADGRIVFEIECDEDGEIIGIKTLERGLSPKAEQMLIEVIRSNSLVKTGGGDAPERSKGRVVFILKTK